MCGFAGILTADGVGRDRLEDGVVRMTEALAHRGPDDNGRWIDDAGRLALGFRRLSIQDLSPAGHQPMVSPSGRFVIVFNGEVYNFRELREELRSCGVSFRGGSDTEVVLAAIERWGIEDALPRFTGMFAIAAWDSDERVLFLTRDRIGIKPLYIARVGGGIAFGSELGALFQAPGFDAELDTSAVAAYLTYLYLPAPLTPLRSVRKVRPGHLIRISERDLPVSELPEGEAWWSVPEVRRAGEDQTDAGGVSDAVDRLEALLHDAVSLRLIADVPLGALLSGGIDSAVVVAMMQRVGSEPARTFTIGFDDPVHDESAYAKRIAEHLGTRHTELHLSGQDALDIVPELPRIFDEPLADPSQIPTYLVSALARRDVTVALSGDGGDELFAGYNRYTSGTRLIPRMMRMPALSRRLLGGILRSVPEARWDRLAGWVSRPGSTRLVGQKVGKLGRMMREDSAREMYRTLISSGGPGVRCSVSGAIESDPIRDGLRMMNGRVDLSDMLELDQRYYLPDDLLQKVDRASMAVGLEVRVPILDHRIVEFSWTLPDHYRIRDGRGKWILREVLHRHVPAAMMDRPKTGFSVPLARWLRGPLKAWAEDLLFSFDPARRELFDADGLRRAWGHLLAGHDSEALSLWTVLMFEAWRDTWKIENMASETT